MLQRKWSTSILEKLSIGFSVERFISMARRSVQTGGQVSSNEGLTIERGTKWLSFTLEEVTNRIFTLHQLAYLLNEESL